MSLTPEQRERIQRWVAALRSGEYKQTTQVLHNDQGYCCLGVACDLYSKTPEGQTSGWANHPSQRNEQKIGFEFATPDADAYLDILPPAVAGYYGLEQSPVIKNPKGHGYFDTLGALNDHGAPFHTIANLIEKEFLANANDD
jgi:hypothetical protein